MITQDIIEEIVRRVLERLLKDPRFQSVAASGDTSQRPKTSSVRQHYGRLLSEWDVLQVHRSGGRALKVSKKTILTPLARDRARDLGVELIIE